MSAKKPFTLYGRQGSGSFCVEVALEEIGASYERIWVGSDPADLERYREINPTGKVPALGLPDGTLMIESAAILTYLALTNPEAKLAPQPGAPRHAAFLQWMSYLSANVYEDVLRIYYSDRYSSRGAADGAAIRDQAKADFVAHVSLINRVLDPYVLGSEYSIADVYLYMLTAWYPEKEHLLARLPALGAHSAKILARPAVAKVEAGHAGG